MFRSALASLVDEVFGTSLDIFDQWPRSGPILPLWKDPINSLGIFGTRMMMARMSISQAPSEFCEEASVCIEAAHRAIHQPATNLALGDLLTEKTWSYAAYDLLVSDKPVKGTAIRDNGFKQAKECRWLRPAKIKAHEWVDRTQCGEYQLLADICDELANWIDVRSSDARSSVTGDVLVYVLSPCCLSCVSVFRQFQHLYPSITMQISIGDVAYVILT